MKIAYGILCHTDAPHIERLVNKLTIGTNNEVIIHVDAKSDIDSFSSLLSNKERVTLLNRSRKIFWGDMRQLKQLSILCELLLNRGSLIVLYCCKD